MPLTRLVTALLAPAVLTVPLLVTAPTPASASATDERERRTAGRAGSPSVAASGAPTVLGPGESDGRWAGRLDATDGRDLLRVEVADLRRVEAVVSGGDRSPSTRRPGLALLDHDGRVLAAGGRDGVRHVVPAAGTYYLAVDVGPGAPGGAYQVHVEASRYKPPRLVGDFERARMGRAYRDVVRVRFGEPRILVSQQGGQLPPGLHARTPNPRTVLVEGVPQRSGRWSMILQVRDALDHHAVRDFRLLVRR